jgi:hypothetical protein
MERPSVAGEVKPLLFGATGDFPLADPLLWVHIVAGAAALLAGLAAIVTLKGGPRHNRAGRIYAVTMGVVVVTAVPLSVWADDWFLFAIALFTAYLIGTGYRIIGRQRAGLTDPATTDYALQGAMLVVGFGMVGGGAYGTIAGVIDLGEVLVVFGLIGGGLAVRELRQLQLPKPDRTPWFERHIAFMGGGYIATVTATITVNLTMVPELARWLGPTVVGVPLITYAVVTYRSRFGGAGYTGRRNG